MDTYGEPCGVGFYYPNWRDAPRYVERTEFPNGMIRKVFVDKHGRPLMTGWFYPNAYPSEDK